MATATPSPEAQAHSHLTIGASLYRAERYAEALREFQAAFELSSNVLLLVNIGQCERKLGNARAAADAFERYLASTPPDDPQRADVQTVAALSRQEAAKQNVTSPDEPRAAPEPVPAPVIAAAPTSAPVAVVATTPAPRSRRKLWIGLGVGGAVLVVGAATLALVFTLPASAPSSHLGTYPLFK